MNWYPTHSEVAAAEARLVRAKLAAISRVARVRSRLTHPSLLAVVPGVLIGFWMLRRRRRGLARALVAPALALPGIAKALLISFGTRELTRLLLRRRTTPAHATYARRDDGARYATRH
jgi:hypothetical protein